MVSQKAQAYADFIRMTAASGHDRSADKLALIADAKARICIYGSLDVVQKLGTFHATGAVAARPEGQDTLIDLLSAMRRDLTGEGFGSQNDIFVKILFGVTDREG